MQGFYYEHINTNLQIVISAGTAHHICLHLKVTECQWYDVTETGIDDPRTIAIVRIWVGEIRAFDHTRTGIQHLILAFYDCKEGKVSWSITV